MSLSLSPLSKDVSTDAKSVQDVDDHPANRAGRPKDIADAAEYLVNAGFVTGQDIVVDGGATKVK